MKVNINNKEIYVWLSNSLFSDLKEKISIHNDNKPKVKLSISIAAYFLNLPNYLRSNRKDEFENGWTPLCAEILRKIRNSSSYINFLVKNKFLDRHKDNYSTSKKECYKYCINKKYKNQEIKLRELKAHKSFVKKRNEEIQERMNTADNKCIHLTKWLNPKYIEVEYENALRYVKSTHKKGQRKSRIIILDKLHDKMEGYSRQGRDNRLHTNLTSLPKDLRKYVRFDRTPISSIDIKNSQPFILASLINSVTNETYMQSCKGITQFLINESIPKMLYQTTKSLNPEVLQRYIEEVQKGVFYERFGQILCDNNVINRNFKGQYYFIDYDKGVRVNKFDTSRGATKLLVMKILFSSEKSNEDVVKVFRKTYPDVSIIIDLIKSNGEKGDFSTLLQRIEANCVLDYCSKKISEKHPKIPILSIHDSLISTCENIGIMENEFSYYLTQYFGLTPELKPEHWNEDSESAA